MPQAAPVTGTETSSPGVLITLFCYSKVIAYQANSGCHSSRVLASWASPHSSPLEGGGFEPSVPHQEGQPSDVVFRFARDSSLEGDGFERSSPRHGLLPNHRTPVAFHAAVTAPDPLPH